jgi:hypothetical protein
MLVRSDDRSFAAWLLGAAAGTPAAPLADGLFGPCRRLFKRVATFDALHQPEIHRACAGRTYPETVAIASRLAAGLSRRSGTTIDPAHLLVDAPPAEREVEFRLQVREVRERSGSGEAFAWRRLEDLSPVVRSLAREQFDDLVKRVRIFAHPDVAAVVRGHTDLEALVREAAAG